MFQEYPKGLSKGDEWRIVHNQDEEAAARAEGYTFAGGEPPAEPAKRRGRPPKAEQ